MVSNSSCAMSIGASHLLDADRVLGKQVACVQSDVRVGCNEGESHTCAVHIQELSHDELRYLLEFLYCAEISADAMAEHAHALLIAPDKCYIPVLSKVCEVFICPKVVISFNAAAPLFLFPKMTACLMELEWTCSTSCKTLFRRKECTVHHEQSEASELLNL
jgi:hypothetical protein